MKFFLSRLLLTFHLTLFIYSSTSAQQSFAESSVVTDYNNALKLYNSKAYAAAQKTFDKVLKTSINDSNLKTDAAYYEAMCAIKLDQTDADKKVLKFVKENPISVKKDKAFFNVGNHYFANKKAAYSLKWFAKVNPFILSKENTKELNFKMGYALLTTNNFKLAKERFLPLINDSKYGNDSRYYYGYLAYKLEDYELAESTLKDIADNDSYKAEISYYLLDISFKAGKFNRCIAVGSKLLKTVKRKEKSNISKILGESYFNLKKYKESIPYLESYTGKKGKWNNTDFYQLGYAYFRENDFKNAINNFNKILDKKNKVTQNAYYHLAECYLNVDKKTEALSAFKAASEMDFNLKIKEDSSLNYAKLSYEEGNPFQRVADVLQDYLKAYPKSKSYKEINNLVINSFLHQQDYLGAINYLSKNRSKENNKIILEVSLYRGIQLYRLKKIKEALPFIKNAKKTTNKKVVSKATYWEAEAQYQLKQYKESLANFIILKNSLKPKNNSEFPQLDYNIGYNYFKLKEYEKAISYFKSTTKNKTLENTILNDAFIRLGDSYFAIREYKKGAISYQNVIDLSGIESDYAQYQIGMSLGFTDNNQAKINALKKVINTYSKSSLKDDALFQLGNTFAKIKENISSHVAYETLLDKHPKSIFIPKALVRQGLLYYNDGKNEEALSKYKRTVKLYPNSPEAFEAVENAKNIYIDNDKIDDYVSWIKGLKFVNISNSDIDNATFAAAEKFFLEAIDKEKTISSLYNYTTSFPDGIHKLKANFYLAETLYDEGFYEKAITAFTIILSEEQTEFSEESLNKLSQIYLLKEDFKEAYPLLLRLEEEANSPANILYAQSNLMRGFYKTQAYSQSIEYAKKILSKEKLDAIIVNDAKIIIARSALMTDDIKTSKEFYNEVENTATGELKAESIYYNAYFKSKNIEYESSNKIIQKLISNYSTYKYWGVKSYVLMAKNYNGLNDVYQATYVLENIIENFKEFDDVIVEAKLELNNIKANEAKRNNSVVNKIEETIKEEKKKN